MLHSSTSRSPKKSTTVRSRTAVRFAKAALQTAYIVSEDLGASLAERLFTSPRRHRRPERERDILATGHPGRAQVTLRSPRWQGETVTVPTWRWGHGQGPTVLLVHGWEGRGSQLGAFVEPLVRAGLTVVAFDAPGHGDATDHRLYVTDVADAIADVTASITAITGAPLHGVVAHSFGAAGVLIAAARNSFTAPRNILIAPNVILDDAVAKFAHLVGLDDADRSLLEQRLAERTGLALDALRLDRLVADRDDRLLVVHDRDDREVGFHHGERLAALWPHAQLVATEGLGHRRILRDEAVIAQVVDSLADGVQPPASDLVREVDRQLDGL
jgi:pimeloyl-ACP methyl ester carboxylesterase